MLLKINRFKVKSFFWIAKDRIEVG